MIDLELNEEERERLANLAKELSDGVEPVPYLEELMSSWKTFIIHVENGYDLYREDYTYDLSSRGILNGIIEELGGRPGKQISDWLIEWDDRFYAATSESKKPVHRLSSDRDTAPWNFRIPKKLLPDLKADLKDLGYLD